MNFLNGNSLYVKTYPRTAPTAQFNVAPNSENNMDCQNDLEILPHAIEKFSAIILKTLPSNKPKIPCETIFALVLQALRIVMNNESNEKSVHKTR